MFILRQTTSLEDIGFLRRLADGDENVAAGLRPHSLPEFERCQGKVVLTVSPASQFLVMIHETLFHPKARIGPVRRGWQISRRDASS
ncbi:hypothetical protein O9X98_15025 [Agrobacterium salinitolerans]|nr:hypothetical protein [Agrobacterium salinitolerans]